jgi:hypothetical protein
LKRQYRRSNETADVSAALEAMNAEELRAFVGQVLVAIDDGPRGQLEDALLRQAAGSASGWKPKGPRADLIPELEYFIEAARRVGSADPRQVDDYLREGVKASLAADHEAAKTIFGMLLPAIGDGNVDLGQHEMVDEVLSVDLSECAARYLLATYSSTPQKERADAFLTSIDSVDPIAPLWDPIAAIERVAGTPVPDIEKFLPLWVKKLESVKTPVGDWESPHDRRLREAVTRSEGIDGLERLARSSRRPEVVRAWCAAVVEKGDWKRALRTYEEAAGLVSSPTWLGDFLDGAALAARELGRHDATKRLEVAFRQAPSLVRLLRWLIDDEPSAIALRKRASSILKDSPTKASRLLGVLHLVAGDAAAAAAVLSKATGLGWSSESHPGHVLFPALAWLLVGAPSDSLRAPYSTGLYDLSAAGLGPGAELEEDGSAHPEPTKPGLSISSVVEILRRASVYDVLTANDRVAMLNALRAAAMARVDGVLGEKRRRHYEHAATLVACCVDLERASGPDRVHSPDWVTALRQRTTRFPAFQAALRRAFAERTAGRI